MPGPTGKHPSARTRRNNPKKDFTTLPAKGRRGKTPPWPLDPDLRLASELEFAQDTVASLQAELDAETDGRKAARLRRQLQAAELRVVMARNQAEQSAAAESSLWAEMWRTPQAFMWEQAHAHRDVAQYVRFKIRAEQGDYRAATEARQWSDRLGLNPLALLRLKVEIEKAAEAEEKTTKRTAGQAPPPAPAGKPDDPEGDPRALYLVS